MNRIRANRVRTHLRDVREDRVTRPMLRGGRPGGASLPVIAMLLAGIGSLHADISPEPLRPDQFNLAPWPQQVPVVVAMNRPGLARVEVDPSLYRHSGKDFAALRLVREADGALLEQPWVVREMPSPGFLKSRFFRQETESLKQTSDGAIEIVVKLTPAPVAALRLEVDTPLRDFEKGVTVSVADDQGAWRDLFTEGILFDHSRFLDFRRTSIDLPRTAARRFRIRIADASEVQRSRLREISRTVSNSSGVAITESERVEQRDFRIDGLRFVERIASAEIPVPQRSIADLAILSQGTGENGVSWIEFDGGNLPIERLEFRTDDRNFRRVVTLQVPGRDGDWINLHESHLHRYEVVDFRDASLALSFPLTRSDRYRLRIANGTNPEIRFTAVSGKGPRHEIFFLAGPGEKFLILLGDEGASVPRFDDAAIRAALSRQTPAIDQSLGSLAPNPGYENEAGPAEPGFLESKTALWIAIAAAVAVLSWVLYGALRTVEKETAV